MSDILSPEGCADAVTTACKSGVLTSTRKDVANEKKGRRFHHCTKAGGRPGPQPAQTNGFDSGGRWLGYL